MLKTSPIFPSSANASPTIDFRHAPAHHHQAGPSRSPSSSSHLPPARGAYPSLSSSTLMTSPRHAARSSSTRNPQSSSTSTSTSTLSSSSPRSSAVQRGVLSSQGAVIAAPPPQPSQNLTSEPPPSQPTIRAQPVVPTTLSVDEVAVAAGPSETVAAALDAQNVNPQESTPLSPNKRRASPTQSIATIAGPSNAAGSSSAQSQENVTSATAPKRIRPEEAPTKHLPQAYEHCPVEDMVELIAHMINELITTNDAIRISNGGLTRFHSRTAPGISVRDYLQRLARHATLTPPLLLAMVYYIDRLCALYQEFTINTLTVHRFLITAATVAAKGLSDSFWNNTTYARVGGVRVAELKLLELEFLYRVDWKIVPNPEVLVAYYRGLVERTPGYELQREQSSGEADEDADDEIDSDESLGGTD